MDIVRARGQDPETCRELFILAADILGLAAVSVGGSRLKPAAPTVERATVRTDAVKRDPMLRQMRGARQIPAETEATVCFHTPAIFPNACKALRPFSALADKNFIFLDRRTEEYGLSRR